MIPTREKNTQKGEEKRRNEEATQEKMKGVKWGRETGNRSADGRKQNGTERSKRKYRERQMREKGVSEGEERE